MNRSGYVFTTGALVVILIVISLASIVEDVEYQDQAVVLNQILATNAYLEQVEDDLSRVLQITGYRALIALEESSASSGAYTSDFDLYFAEAMQNGTINGTLYDVLDQSTLNDFVARVNTIATQQGITVSLSVDNITAYHISPFVVGINSTLLMQVAMQDNITSWNLSEMVQGSFTIEDLRDPLYAVGTVGRVPVVVRRSNVSTPYISATNDTTNLQLVWNNTYYLADPLAPSFLMRFAGNLSASPHGIVSLVDTKDLENQELVIFTTRSLVDYRYFGNDTHSTNMIVNMPDEFLIDDDHLALYDAVGKTR